MADFKVGQQVEANLTGITPALGQGSYTRGTIVGIEGEIYLVRTTEFSDGLNKLSLFRLTADRLTAL